MLKFTQTSRISIITMLPLLVFVLNSGFLCNKDDNDTTRGNYSFEYTIGGQRYSWSGGLPSGSSTIVCAYTPATPSIGAMPQIILGGDVRVSPYNILIGGIPSSNTGSFTFNGPTLINPNRAFVLSFASVSTTNPEVYYGNPVTLNINSISQQQFGVVSGSFSGTVQNPVSGVKKSINGTFRAYRN